MKKYKIIFEHNFGGSPYITQLESENENLAINLAKKMNIDFTVGGKTYKLDVSNPKIEEIV